MDQEMPKHVFPNARVCQRGGDRRSCLQPPPYQTCDGLVLKDRRSHLDRRASWVREFSFEMELPG